MRFRVKLLTGMLWLLVRGFRVIGFVESCRSCIDSCHLRCVRLLKSVEEVTIA